MMHCIACEHAIDESAKLCPYCGADPLTGKKFDTKPLVEAHFPPREDMAPVASAMSFLRQRQGIVVTAIVLGSFLLLTFVHQLVSRRNQAAVTDVPAIPLTEVADLSRQADAATQPVPQVKFSYAGDVRTVQTFLVEPGAVAPPQPIQPPPAGQRQVSGAPQPQSPSSIMRMTPSRTATQPLQGQAPPSGTQRPAITAPQGSFNTRPQPGQPGGAVTQSPALRPVPPGTSFPSDTSAIPEGSEEGDRR